MTVDSGDGGGGGGGFTENFISLPLVVALTVGVLAINKGLEEGGGGGGGGGGPEEDDDFFPDTIPLLKMCWCCVEEEVFLFVSRAALGGGV